MSRNVIVGICVFAVGARNIYDLIGSRCTRLWLCHLFAVLKFPFPYIWGKWWKTWDREGDWCVDSSFLWGTQPGLFCWPYIYIVRSSAVCDLRMDKFRVIILRLYFFLGPCARITESTVSFVMSVCPSVRMEQFGSHCTDFHETGCSRIFRTSVKKIQFPLKSDKNNGYIT